MDKDEIMATIKNALAMHYDETDWDKASDYAKVAGAYLNGKMLSLDEIVSVIEEALY